MAAIRVIVADDQVLVRAGVTSLLKDLGDFECVASVPDSSQCLRACSHTAADILLLDLHMPGNEDLTLLHTVSQAFPAIKVVILTGDTSPDMVNRCLNRGAVGFVSKDFVLDELAMALRMVMAGRNYISPEVAVSSLRSPRTDIKLTPRQTDVLRCIAQGRSNKEIARELEVSVKTVEYHRAELIQRLDLHDVASLTRYAMEHGLAHV